MSVLATLFERREQGRGPLGSYTGGGRLSDSPGWLEKLLAGRGGRSSNASGIDVDEDEALEIDAFFCAVQLLSNAATLPMSLYRRRGDGGRDLAIDHPAQQVIHSRWQPRRTARAGRKLLETWRWTWGNGYAEIERDRRKNPLRMHPIHPSRVLPRTGEDAPYLVRNNDGTYTTLDAADVFHVMGFSKDGVNGISIVRMACETFGFARAVEIYGAAFFGNGARPDVVLKHPSVLDDESYSRMRDSWVTRHGGADNSHRPAILEDGTDLTVLGMPNEDAQFLETRSFSVQQFARLTNVPPHKLKDLSRATFSNIEHQQIEYVSDAIVPIAICWEDETDIKLLRPGEEASLFSKMNLNAQLRGDAASRSAYYKAMWEMGVLTINNILALEDMNPIGPAGDVHYVQMNLTTAEKVLRELSRKDAADPEAQEQLKFLREVVKGYLSDKTTNDVMFNMTNVRELLKMTQVPAEPGMVEPFMPVRDERGALVSGDVIKDKEGDIVGGAPIAGTEAQASTAKNADAAAGDPATESTEDTETDPAKDEGDGGANDPTQSTIRNPQSAISPEAARRLMMPVLVDAAARVVRKEVNAARRAVARHAGDSDGLGAWAAGFYEELAADLGAAMLPGVGSLCELMGGDCAGMELAAVIAGQRKIELLAAVQDGKIETVLANTLAGDPGKIASTFADAVKCTD